MCTGNRQARRAAQAQAEATAKLAAAQRAKTTDMVANTQGVIQTNKSTRTNRPIYSLRIPLNNAAQDSLGTTDNTYGLNIPL